MLLSLQIMNIPKRKRARATLEDGDLVGTEKYYMTIWMILWCLVATLKSHTRIVEVRRKTDLVVTEMILGIQKLPQTKAIVTESHQRNEGLQVIKSQKVRKSRKLNDILMIQMLNSSQNQNQELVRLFQTKMNL